MVYSGRTYHAASAKLLSKIGDPPRDYGAFITIGSVLSLGANGQQDDDLDLCRAIVRASDEALAPLITAMVFAFTPQPEDLDQAVATELRKLALNIFGLQERG